MRSINWVTGGSVSLRWAYGTNARRLISKLHNYTHDLDNNVDIHDIVVFFDILLLNKGYINFPKAKKVLRLSGVRPFNILKDKKISCVNIIKKADSIVSVNKSLLDDYIISNNTKKYIIPNSVNTKLFNPDGYVPPKEFTIGFSGNVSNAEKTSWKGFDLVQEVSRKMNIPLLTALYNKNEIDHNKMKTNFYHKISCLIHPSISEGCSNTVSEALACGIPVIMYKGRGYHSENLSENYNVIFCDRYVDNICNRINYLRDSNIFDTFHRTGPEFIKANQDLEIIYKEWEKVFKEL